MRSPRARRSSKLAAGWVRAQAQALGPLMAADLAERGAAARRRFIWLGELGDTHNKALPRQRARGLLLVPYTASPAGFLARAPGVCNPICLTPRVAGVSGSQAYSYERLGPGNAKGRVGTKKHLKAKTPSPRRYKNDIVNDKSPRAELRGRARVPS